MPVLTVNKKAHFDYELLETYSAGLVLSGPEVKSVKLGQVSLKGAYVVLKASQNGRLPSLFLINATITAYKFAKNEGYKVDQARKLLLTKREINYLLGKSQEKGLTMVPLKIYTKSNLVKLDFALGKGKKKFDKREDIKRRDVERDMRREIKK